MESVNGLCLQTEGSNSPSHYQDAVDSIKKAERSRGGPTQREQFMTSLRNDSIVWDNIITLSTANISLTEEENVNANNNCQRADSCSAPTVSDISLSHTTTQRSFYV
mgnify:CR=1 FL=1